MVSRRLQKRIEGEAAEKRGKKKAADGAAPKKRKAAAKKTTTRKRKTKAPERKRLLWGVFSGTLKEEGRYAYDERDKAEERLEQLRSKSKKLYFIQPIKEVISDAPPAEETSVPPEEEEVAEAAPEPEAEADEEEGDEEAAQDEDE